MNSITTLGIDVAKNVVLSLIIFATEPIF